MDKSRVGGAKDGGNPTLGDHPRVIGCWYTTYPHELFASCRSQKPTCRGSSPASDLAA